MRPPADAYQELPSISALCHHSQLAILTTLQTTLRLAEQVLAIEHPDHGFLNPFADVSSPEDILAQLVLDRCRELSQVLWYYQRAVCPAASLPDTTHESYF
jgi:hypothetical protein